MVRVNSWWMVKPAKPTPGSGVCISDCDQDKPITHAPIVYFYGPTSSSPAMETLKDTLSQALVYFYPLAGRLHWTTGGRVELNCNSMGAAFYEAESDTKIKDFGDFCPNRKVRSLVPSPDYTAPLPEIPLLVIQVTKFRCGGFSLGFGVSHIMVDGMSVFHFISEWARIARGGSPKILPSLDRTVLMARDPPTPVFNHERFSPPPLLIGQMANKEERNKETTATMLHVSRIQIEKLKKMANEGRSAEIRAYSRYEAVAGHLWRCASKARRHDSRQLTKLRVQVNIRDRVEPPLPEGYFGNALLTVMATSESGELITRPLSYGSSRIRESIDMVSKEYVRSALDYVKIQPDLNRFRTFHTVGSNQGAFYGNPNFEITSWLNLGAENKDFGWGNEILVVPGTLAFDGKCFVLPGKAEKGSLVIAVRLQVTHMDAFRKFFYQDMYCNSRL